jgi:cell division protein FtsZ
MWGIYSRAVKMVNFKEYKKDFLYHEPTVEFMNAVTEMLRFDGIINLNEQDLNKVRKSGNALACGFGRSKGSDGLNNAVTEAISKDMMIKSTFTNANSILIHMKAGKSYSLHDMGEAFDLIFKNCPPGIDVTFGLSINRSAINECEILLITNGWLYPK